MDSNATGDASATTAAELDEPRDERLAAFEVATLAAIFATIVIGNLCVLVALWPGRARLRRLNFFLLHLSVADLITGFFNVLPQLIWDITYRFYGNDLLCKVIKLLQIFGPYLSSYVLVVTAIDRFQAICHPMAFVSARSSHAKAKIMICVAYVISFLFSVPQMFIFSYQSVGGETFDCWGSFPQPYGERAYVTWYAVSCFFLPLIVLFYTYTRICVKLYKVLGRQNRANSSATDAANAVIENVEGHGPAPVPTGAPDEGRRSRFVSVSIRRLSEIKNSLHFVEFLAAGSRAERTNKKRRILAEPRRHSMSGLTKAKVKSVKLTIVVIVCYLVCSLPFIVVQLWVYWSEDRTQSILWRSPIITIVMLMASLNSSVNPWIYLFFNDDLLRNLKDACCCVSRSGRARSSRTSGDL